MNKKLPLIFISILIFVILLLLFLPGKSAVYELKDRCGPIVNMISHTIADENACTSQCKSQCETKDMTFKKIDFSNDNPGCNICTCTCNEKWI